jgi:hypothetical protein
VAAAGRVTVAANAEFAPTDPFVPSWARPLTRVVGTVTLYLAAGSEQWRPDDARLPGVSIIAYAAEL